MTRIRKLALNISNQVVRWASPGCKEWAEGLAREIAFIQSDWAALRWSLGSLRIVFDRREMPISSLDEVPAQFKKFPDLLDINDYFVFLGLVYSMTGFGSAFLLFRARSETGYLGSYLNVLASLSGWIFIWARMVEQYRLKQQMTDDVLENVAACALTYMAALRRRCSEIWIPAFVIASWVIGTMLEWGGFRAFPILNSIFFLYVVGVVLVLRNVQRNYQRRIERLDQLLAERSGTVGMDRMN